MNSPYFSPLRKNIESLIKLSDKDWNLLLPHLKIVKLKKRERFGEIGKKANQMGFVLEGMLRHFYLKGDEEKTTYFYFENELVGAYFSCITNQPSLMTIEALTDCVLIVFPYDALLKLYKKSVAWQEFGRLLSEYLAVCIEERMISLLMLNPEERYLELIGGKNGKIFERVPQHYIANFLGITPVSMSRIRGRVSRK